MITFLPLSVPFATAGDASLRTQLQHHDGEHKLPLDSASGAVVRANGGEDSVEQPKALAYLLQMDDIRILIDCGSPEDFLFAPATTSAKDSDAHTDDQREDAQKQQQKRHKDLETLAAGPLDEILRRLAPTIDLVLLSHSTLSHLGFYAYAHAKLGLRCLAYATMPVQSMGKLTVTEAIEAWRSEIDADKECNEVEAMGGIADRRCLATLDEVDEAFEAIKTVRYLQPTHLEGKCTGITLTAYNAGHALGGAVWKIRSPTSGTVLIALDWNHNRERHLDGTALLVSSGAAAPSAAGGSAGSGGISDAVRRPDLLITEIQRGLVVNVRRKDRDAALLDLVHRTIQGGHSVLFPVDASARLLELLVLLDQHWAYAYPHARFPLCLVSRTGKEVLERSRTYMEWMTREWATKAGEAATADDGGGGNEGARGHKSGGGSRKGKGMKSQALSSPLDFKFLKVFPTLAALDDAVPRDQAKVVLAVPPSMTHGPSRRLFSRFAERPGDLVVLLQQGEPGSLSRHLWDAWNAKQDKTFQWTHGKLGNTVSPQLQVDFELKSKVPLEGDELRAFLEAEQAEKEKQAQQRALLARSRRRLEADENDEDDSDEDDEDDDDESIGGEGAAAAGRLVPVGKVEGGGFAEPGSMAGRKRKNALAFDEGGGRDGGGGIGGGGDGATDGGNGESAMQVSFDIYLKGNASRATTFFGSKANGQEGPFGVGVRYRLFPVVERKRRIDSYGETVDVARWLSRRKEIEANGVGGGSDGLNASSLADGSGAADDRNKRRQTGEGRTQTPSPPSKYITEHVTVTVSCRLAFVEMVGLNDGRALKTLIPQMHPRRLITVNGDAATRRDMLAALTAVKSMTKEIFAPTLWESVRIGELTNSYSVVLGDTLLKGLKMSRFEDYEVAHVHAAVRLGVESTIPTLEAAAVGATISELSSNAVVAEAGKKETETTSATALVSSIRTKLSQLPGQPRAVSSLVPPSSHTLDSTLFVGDLKLSTLKAALSSSTYRLASEFAGEGMLVCGAQNGTEAVTIKKESQGRIVIESNVGRRIREVRAAVYGLHAIV